MQLHEQRRAGRHERNYYAKHLQAFYVLRDSLALHMGADWDTWHDWYNDKLRTDPKSIAKLLRSYAAKQK